MLKVKINLLLFLYKGEQIKNSKFIKAVEPT